MMRPWRTKRCGNCAEWFATRHLGRRYCDDCKRIVERRAERKRQRLAAGIPLDAPVAPGRRTMRPRTFVYRPQQQAD